MKKTVYCKCGNNLSIWNEYAEDGDLCLDCRKEIEQRKDRTNKSLKSKTRDNTRNQYTTGFYR